MSQQPVINVRNRRARRRASPSSCDSSSDSESELDREFVAVSRALHPNKGQEGAENGGAGNAADAVAPHSAVLYGLENRSGRIDWRGDPHHPDEPAPVFKNEHAAYVVRKTSEGRHSPWELHSIIVQSPQIMEILRPVLADYPGVSAAVDRLTLEQPFQPMVHRWTEFCEAVEAADESAKEHIAGLVDLLKEELEPTFQVLRDADKHRVIDYDHLWAIFPPGGLVWWDVKDNDSIGRVLETAVDSEDDEAFVISYQNMVWTGEELKLENGTLDIKLFTGTRPIDELKAIPLSRKADVDEVRAAVLKRGEKLLSLLGCRYRDYQGFGMLNMPVAFSMCGRPLPPPPGRGGKPQWESISGRVVLDAATWHGKVGDRKEKLPDPPTSLTEEELLICAPTLKGYALATKKWYKLFVDGVSEIEWDDSISKLVMDQVEKDLLLGFAQMKLSQTSGFDDIVRGKGKGVVILLSGPPGVGKTLTVESIANAMHVPLYTLSAGELGIQPEMVESRLRQALIYCKEWNAVLLMDEADIFLEERSTSHLQRNELISIFLRLLEYYDGMMFLTTNRMGSMDPAFHSRIDLVLPYPSLSESSRASIWRNFLQTDTTSTTEFDLEELAAHVLNGRQIKNVVKLAHMLATKREEKLNMHHLRQIIKLAKKNFGVEEGEPRSPPPSVFEG